MPTNKKYGEMAVKLGLLSPERFKQVLGKQSELATQGKSVSVRLILEKSKLLSQAQLLSVDRALGITVVKKTPTQKLPATRSQPQHVQQPAAPTGRKTERIPIPPRGPNYGSVQGMGWAAPREHFQDSAPALTPIDSSPKLAALPAEFEHLSTDTIDAGASMRRMAAASEKVPSPPSSRSPAQKPVPPAAPVLAPEPQNTARPLAAQSRTVPQARQAGTSRIQRLPEQQGQASAPRAPSQIPTASRASVTPSASARHAPPPPPSGTRMLSISRDHLEDAAPAFQRPPAAPSDQFEETAGLPAPVDDSGEATASGVYSDWDGGDANPEVPQDEAIAPVASAGLYEAPAEEPLAEEPVDREPSAPVAAPARQSGRNAPASAQDYYASIADAAKSLDDVHSGDTATLYRGSSRHVIAQPDVVNEEPPQAPAPAFHESPANFGQYGDVPDYGAPPPLGDEHAPPAGESSQQDPVADELPADVHQFGEVDLPASGDTTRLPGVGTDARPSEFLAAPAADSDDADRLLSENAGVEFQTASDQSRSPLNDDLDTGVFHRDELAAERAARMAAADDNAAVGAEPADVMPEAPGNADGEVTPEVPGDELAAGKPSMKAVKLPSRRGLKIDGDGETDGRISDKKTGKDTAQVDKDGNEGPRLSADTTVLEKPRRGKKLLLLLMLVLFLFVALLALTGWTPNMSPINSLMEAGPLGGLLQDWNRAAHDWFGAPLYYPPVP